MDDMIQAGMDVVRLNFSHDNPEAHIRRAENMRNRARAHGHQVGVLADMQGPKIRIERFKDGKIKLEKDDRFILDAGMDPMEGTGERVGLTYSNLPNDVHRGDTLLLDDGHLVLWVDEVVDAEIRCRVVVGGELSNNKGINRLGGGLSAEAITEKDRADIRVAAEMGADYVAVSFPRSADDIHLARQLLQEAGGHGGMDFLMMWRMIYCLRNGEPLDQDVYDAASWSVVSPLSEKSVGNRSLPVDFPDYTRGKWKSMPPLGVIA